MTEPTDRPAKIARLHAILEKSGARAIQLTAPENLAWLFDGARFTVPFGGPAVASALVDADGHIAITALRNEAARLCEEELADAVQAGVDVHTVAWHGGIAAPVPGAIRDTDIPAAMRHARAVLLPAERARYETFCAELATRIGRIAGSVQADDTERDVAARLLAAIGQLGAEPVVVLVAGQSRTGVQHPLPTTAPVGQRAIIAVGARRHGMIANLTRTVSLGAPRHPHEQALYEVEADALVATVPGRGLGNVLEDIASAYARHGLGEEAWLAHHQGGPTGYLGRDPKVMPGETAPVYAGQAYAWNPWIPGAKVEDTVIVDDGGMQVLTVDPDWPTVTVRGIARPATLELA